MSVREGIGKVVRSKRIKVKYYTIDDQVVEEEVADMTARIFQHEIDHLFGILFIDKKPTILLSPWKNI